MFFSDLILRDLVAGKELVDLKRLRTLVGITMELGPLRENVRGYPVPLDAMPNYQEVDFPKSKSPEILWAQVNVYDRDAPEER